MTTYELFGPVDDALGTGLTEEILVIEVVLLGLLVANMAVRAFDHRRHVSQAREDGAGAVARHPLHLLANLLLLLAAFYYLTLHPHAGMVTSVLVLGVVLADVFEFESRKVEARRDLDLDRPKAAISASLLALVYVLYVTFFSGPLGQFV